MADASSVDGMATSLRELGLFLGVGDLPDGTPDFALERKPSRVEALVMLVRAIGKEAEADALGRTHPFADVPDWADGYVSYGYLNGLTDGVSETAFGALSDATAEMYLTFMLRALGYAEGAGADFVWSSPWAFADSCGIVPPELEQGADFLRGDVVRITCAALFAKLKGGDKLLHERLTEDGAFTSEQLAKAFSRDPYAEYHAETGFDKTLRALARNGASVEISAETDSRAVLSVTMGGLPHGAAFFLYLVSKPDGMATRLPTPDENGWGAHTAPKELTLAADAGTLRYTYVFPQRLVIAEGQPDERVVHEAGTYVYVADLKTGETALRVE